MADTMPPNLPSRKGETISVLHPGPDLRHYIARYSRPSQAYPGPDFGANVASFGMLNDILILLLAAVSAMLLGQKLKLGSVLGYLVAGAVIGPSGLALIGDIEEIRHIGEFGVVFLLFAIGLEMKLARLAVMRRYVLGLGSAQVLLTGAIVALAAWGAGFPVKAAIVTGGGLALSSTAVVLQLLIDRGELTSRAGRIAFAVLILQDLAVVPLLALVPLLSDAQGASSASEMALAGLEAMGVILCIILAGRYLLRPALRLVAASRSNEAFAASAILVVLGTSWLTNQVGLSMALGAFLAGLMLAETEFRHQVEADIAPFRGFLLGLFFITVGMSVDIPAMADQIDFLVVTVVGLLAVKIAVMFGLGRIFGLEAGAALHSGLLLAQGGEFGFVLFGLAISYGVMQPDLGYGLILAISLTMMATPFLAALGARIGAKLPAPGPIPGAEALEDSSELHRHVIIAGFGRVGQTVARMLAERDVPYVALDLHSERVALARAKGLPVFYADASQAEVLRGAGAAHARAVVVTLDGVDRSERCVASLHHAFPGLPVFARARDISHGGRLRAEGATLALPETVEASLQLGATVLRSVGIAADDVTRLLDECRRDDYAWLAQDLAEAAKPPPGAQ